MPSPSAAGSPAPAAPAPAAPAAPLGPAVLATRCAWGDCSVQLASVHQLSAHISTTHVLVLAADAGYACAWRGCPQNAVPLPSYHALVDHLRTHTGNRSYLCPVLGCGKVYKRTDFLTKHISAHADAAPPPPPMPSNGHHSRRRPPPGSPADNAASSDSDSAGTAAPPDSDAHAAVLAAQLAYIRIQVAERKRLLARHRTKARRLRLENDILIDALAQQ
ncbi:hypothetical protein LPJ61_001819 [Coemansia biformis]|uniref:C2H2-type domain-containing protein n=1 Tax=Coemansia biformis TaxID=1286918 RepID=A0A9W8D090_9FUNG|nr:hypothetical protein LPJ61_001819 [Coemansia biformis]